jgi:hypothetical protein
MSVDGAPLFTEETNAGTDRRVLWADNKLFVYRVVTHNDECSWEGSFWDAKTNRWSVVKNAFSPRSEGGFRTVWSEGGTPTTLQLYSVNLNLASGTLYGCKKFSMVQRADSEYSGDQLVYAGDQIFLFSNKLPLVPPSTEAR